MLSHFFRTCFDHAFMIAEKHGRGVYTGSIQIDEIMRKFVYLEKYLSKNDKKDLKNDIDHASMISEGGQGT